MAIRRRFAVEPPEPPGPANRGGPRARPRGGLRARPRVRVESPAGLPQSRPDPHANGFGINPQATVSCRNLSTRIWPEFGARKAVNADPAFAGLRLRRLGISGNGATSVCFRP
jgi:hypothetical protein